METYRLKHGKKIMTKSVWDIRKHAAGKALLLMVVLLLVMCGCTLPIAIRTITITANGTSYITTNKTLSDHGLSYILDSDCSMLRVMSEKPICKEQKDLTN